VAIWFEATLLLSKEGREKTSQQFSKVKEITIKAMFKGVRPQELSSEGDVILAIPDRFIRLKGKPQWLITIEGRASTFIDVVKLANELKIPPDRIKLFEPHRDWHHEP